MAGNPSVSAQGFNVMETSPDPQAAIGRAIRARRREMGLSQQTLGIETNLKQSWISFIELGHANPSYGTVDRIARALGLSMWQLTRLADELESDDRLPTNEPLPYVPRERSRSTPGEGT